MSKGILGVALTITGVALMAIPGIGTALGLGALSIAGASIGVGAMIGLGLEIAGSLLLGPSLPKGNLTQKATSRLYATLVTTEPRKIAFGIPRAATTFGISRDDGLQRFPRQRRGISTDGHGHSRPDEARRPLEACLEGCVIRASQNRGGNLWRHNDRVGGQIRITIGRRWGPVRSISDAAGSAGGITSR